MDHIAGMLPTGRRLLGPASDLVELEAENGLRHTAIVFHPELREHPGITDALEVVRSFLESPLVTGLVELVGHDPDQGAFLYPTGTVWSVAEIIQVLSDLGEPAGTRAGLELMYTAGQILVEGADAGSAAGVYSHGGLTPRRIMIKQDGQVMVIGHALPQVEILQFKEGGHQVPREDSFRYCPPERLEGRPEDVTSDLFSLALIGFELMTGKPVYDGLVNDIRQQAARGEGSRRLFRFREVVDERIRDVLTQMLRPDLAARYSDGDDFLDAVHGLLSQRRVEGPSLIELMEKVSGAGQRPGQKMEAGRTLMVDKDVLATDLAPSTADAQAEGRRPEQNWTPGRRRSVRRRGGDLENMLQASRTLTPPGQAPTPTVVEVEESKSASAVSEPEQAESPGSHRWSKVQRAPARRRSPRERAPDPTPSAPPPPQVPDASGSGPLKPDRPEAANAESLLARIRGETQPSPPEEPQVLSAELSDADPAVLAPTRSDDAATVMMTRDQLQATVADVLDGDGRVAVLDTTQAQSGQPLEPTVSLEHRDSGGFQTYQVVPPGGGAAVEVQLPSAATSAEAVGWMVGSVAPIPVDMSGRVMGWYRLSQGGQVVSADAPISSLKADQKLALAFIPSESWSAQIEVVQGDSTVRFMSPVGSCIPVSSLVAHLQTWLGLSPGPWRLFRDGVQLGNHAVLADGGAASSLTLVLRQDEE